MKITIIYRNARSGFSIYKVINTIAKELVKRKISINSFFLPIHTASITALFINAFALLKLKSSTVFHISGDVHYIAYFLTKKRTVVTVHDIMYYSYLKGVKKWMWKKIYIDSLKRAAVLVFISEFAKRQVLEHINITESKMLVIPNAVGQEYKHFPRLFNDKNPIILHIGTLERKNLTRTIEALDGISCHLRIIGELNDNHLFLLKKHHIEYSNAVGLSDAEILSEYQQADMVNFPSLFEGFGMPIIEAQAIGRAVVTSGISPMKEVAGSDGAYFVEPENIVSLRTAYLDIISNVELREKIVSAGLANVKNYEAERIADRYMEAFKMIGQ